MSFGSTWGVATSAIETGVEKMGSNRQEDIEFLSAGKAGFKMADNPDEVKRQEELHLRVYSLLSDDERVHKFEIYQEDEYVKTKVVFRYLHSDYKEEEGDDKESYSQEEIEMQREMIRSILINPDCYIEKYFTDHESTYCDTTVIFKKVKKEDKSYEYSGMSNMKSKFKSGY